MKLFMASLATETNTFSPMPTGAQSWIEETLAEMRPANLDHAGLPAEEAPVIWEFLAHERGWEVVDSPIHRYAAPAGLIIRAVYEQFRDEILDSLRSRLPVDAVLLALHGGSVAEGYDDPEGDLITRVRELVGPGVPVGVLLDPHTNLGDGMRNATALIFFKEYPHIDVPERAIDLFHLIADAAEGKTRPAMGVFDCRMVGIFQTPRQPLRGFIDHYSELEGHDGVLSITVCQGFPYSDVPIGGTKMVVITDGDQAQADRLAEELGRELFELREAMLPEYLSIEQGLDRALAAPPGTVVIADYADNAGGGAPSDSTFVLRAMLERGLQNAAIGMFWDPIALSIAMEAGEGARLPLRVGGKMGPTSGDPLDLDVTVTKITPDATGKVMGGARIGEFGDLVGLQVNGIDIVLTNRRQQPTSLDCFRQVGIEPTERRIVVVKSSQHFYAAFAPIASEVLYVYSPGTLSPLMQEIPYKRLPTERLWPWNSNPFGE